MKIIIGILRVVLQKFHIQQSLLSLNILKQSIEFVARILNIGTSLIFNYSHVYLYYHSFLSTLIDLFLILILVYFYNA